MTRTLNQTYRCDIMKKPTIPCLSMKDHCLASTSNTKSLSFVLYLLSYFSWQTALYFESYPYFSDRDTSMQDINCCLYLYQMSV